MTTFAPIDRWANEGPGFNKPVAEAVFSTIMKMDADEAVMFTRMLADATVADELMVHGEQIAKAAAGEQLRRAELLKSRLARTAIAKARDGQDPTDELLALDVLSKNFIGDLFDWAHRSVRAKRQQHDASSGRFVREGPIDIDHDSEQRYPDEYNDNLNIPEANWVRMSPEEKSAYQQAYHQVSALVRPYHRMPEGTAYLHIEDNHGGKRTITIPHGDEAALDAADFTPTNGRKVVRASVSVLPPANEKGAYFSLFDAIGLPGLGTVAAGATTNGALDPDRVTSFGEQYHLKDPNDQFIPSQRVFRRLHAGSSLIEDTLGPAAPPQAKMALKVAQHVGQLGPAAQAVIGPTVDRAAYRYRGTERKPDPALRNALRADAHTAAKQTTLSAEATRELRDIDALRAHRLGQNQTNHDQAVGQANRDWERVGMELKAGAIDRGMYRAQAKRIEGEINHARNRQKLADKAAEDSHASASAVANKRIGRGAEELADQTSKIVFSGYEGDNDRWKAGETLGYFKNLVPSPALNELHLKSGTVPPSQGVILDGNGEIANQAVGYGDDHYLPFTLRGMRAMRGGSYLRTRTWGGPTAEDIRNSMMGGAKRFTVVSNNGVFVLTYDPSFKGGRRHNDKARRMTGRYEHLLDAVRSEQVSRAGIDPGRLEVLEAQAKARFNPDYDQKGYDKELLRLKIAEKKDPKLSPAQLDEASTEFLRDLAAEVGTKGAEFTPQDLVDQVADRIAGPKHAEAVAAANRQYSNDLDQWREIGQWSNRGLPAGQQLAAPVKSVPPSLEQIRQQETDKLWHESPTVAAANIAAAMSATPKLNAFLERTRLAHRDEVRELRLDGPGYAAALNGLREQFPYYIASTEFFPWENQAQRTDSGYVLPGRLRPNKAQAGFFGVDGGKVHADTIRWQTGKVERIKDENVKTETADTKAAESAEPDADLTKRIDRNMLDALLGQQLFGPNAFLMIEGKRKSEGLANTDIRRSAEHLPPELKYIFVDKTRDQLLDELERNPGVFHGKLRAAVGWFTNQDAHPVGDTTYADTLKDFNTGGKAAATATTTDTSDILNRPDREFDWVHQRGTVYVPNSGQPPADMEREYRSNLEIAPLVGSGALPFNLDAPDFTTKATALRAQLLVDDGALFRYNRAKIGPPPVRPEEHRAKVVGLVLALKLHERYGEALSNEQNQARAAARDAAAAAGGDPAWEISNSVQFANWSPEQIAQIAKDPELAASVRAGIDALKSPEAREDALRRAAVARQREQDEARGGGTQIVGP